MGRKPRELHPLFRTWTPELAWWLGVVYGDGHVAHHVQANGDKRRAVTLVGCDLDLLKKWRSLVGVGRGGPQQRRQKGALTAVWTAALYGGRISEWCAKRGISGNKAGRLPWPEDLPKELVVHFVRGLWDTDGSVLWRNKDQRHDSNRVPSLRLSYCSKSQAFVRRLLREVPFPLTYELSRRKSGRYAGYEYGNAGIGGEAAEAFFVWLYGDSPAHLRLDRKRDTGLEFMKWIEANTLKCDLCTSPVRCNTRCAPCRQRKCVGQLCVADGCQKAKILAKGLCRTHYHRQWKEGRRA